MLSIQNGSTDVKGNVLLPFIKLSENIYITHISFSLGILIAILRSLLVSVFPDNSLFDAYSKVSKVQLLASCIPAGQNAVNYIKWWLPVEREAKTVG